MLSAGVDDDYYCEGLLGVVVDIDDSGLKDGLNKAYLSELLLLG